MTSRSLKKNMAPEELGNQDLYRAIRGVFTRGKLTKVEVRHITRGGDSMIRTWDEEHFEGLGPDDFSEQLLEACEEDAATLPGMQRYGVFVFRKSQSVHAERLILRVKGGDSEDIGSVFDSEEPDDRGRTSQIMRHDEAFARLTLGAANTSQNILQRQLDSAIALNERMGGQMLQIMELAQRMIDRTAERDLRLERERKTYEMIDMAVEKVGTFIPLLIASKVEKSQPQLAAMIKRSVLEGGMPAPVVKLLKKLEGSPEKTAEFLGLIDTLDGGREILSELMVAYEQHKMTQNGSALTKD